MAATTRRDSASPDAEGSPHDAAFEALLEHVRSARGFDFTGYKRGSLRRRIDKRMEQVGIDDYSEYQDHLEVNPDEYVALFNTILINVTGFFRDPEAWDALRQHVVPRILDRRQPSRQPIRIWCAACSSGQEAYSLAMVLAEELGIEEFIARVKIYGTDLDEEDLDGARQAVYTEDEVDNVPEGQLGRYFDRLEDGRFRFRKDLRRSVIFGVHDIVQDAPISNLDLLSCRNTLMYFNADLQKRVLDRFHFALRPQGFLFLGRAETLLTYSDLFEPVDLGHRLFSKTSEGRDRHGRQSRSPDAGRRTVLADGSEVLAAAFDSGPVAQLVVDDDGYIVTANVAARSTFDLREGDIGRPLKDLEISYRPVELRSLIERAHRDGRPATVEHAEMGDVRGGDQRFLDITVSPLSHAHDGDIGTSITFTDVTEHVNLRQQLEDTTQELQAAYEDLQSSNEELETTNEELQSTIEELETTNEELQSSNEELETMNEELQSTNDELEIINRELQLRTEEADRANAYLRSILEGIRGAVVVVGRDLEVRMWSPKARELWGLTQNEVEGRDFTGLDIGLPVDELRHAIQACISEGSTYELDRLQARDRRGKDVVVSVRTTPLHGPGDGITGAILLMQTIDEGE